MATGMNKEKFFLPLLVILTPLPFENIPLDYLNFSEVFIEKLKKYSMQQNVIHYTWMRVNGYEMLVTNVTVRWQHKSLAAFQ